MIELKESIKMELIDLNRFFSYYTNNPLMLCDLEPQSNEASYKIKIKNHLTHMFKESIRDVQGFSSVNSSEIKKLVEHALSGVDFSYKKTHGLEIALLIYNKDRVVIGEANVSISPLNKEVYILSLTLSPNSRGKGIGGEVSDLIINFAMSIGYYIALEYREGFIGSKSFWENKGFVKREINESNKSVINDFSMIHKESAKNVNSLNL